LTPAVELTAVLDSGSEHAIIDLKHTATVIDLKPVIILTSVSLVRPLLICECVVDAPRVRVR
jgi:hypothetical protein